MIINENNIPQVDALNFANPKSTKCVAVSRTPIPKLTLGVAL